MLDTSKIDKVLVVLSPDLIRPDKPMDSALLQRAVALARSTGCELELFHVCHDDSLEFGLLSDNDRLERERVRVVDEDATRLAEMAARLSPEGVHVSQDVRWDYPRTDAILRKIAQSGPDLVMKAAREHSYLLGIKSNTDWELARRSPAHVWLVSESVDKIDRILAAVGSDAGKQADLTDSADFDLFRAARLVGELFESDIYPVNAYQLPADRAVMMGPSGVPFSATAAQPQPVKDDAKKQHEEAIAAFAKYFHIPADHVHVRQGHPSDVIPEVADALSADMVVMGASSIGRLERLLSAVTVEPVIAESDCDLLIIRDPDLSDVPDVAKEPFYGMPHYDLEQAIVNPQDTFESPQDVANMDGASIGLRWRILQGWEHDIREELTLEDEGGPVQPIDVSLLDEILTARELLRMKKDRSTNEQSKLTA